MLDILCHKWYYNKVASEDNSNTIINEVNICKIIFKIILKKCLTNASDCDILDELSLRRQRKITKNLDN